MKTIRTSTLEIAYEESVAAGGPSVILLHGWPSDPHDYDEVAPLLVAGGRRCNAFRRAPAPRSKPASRYVGSGA